MKIKGETITIKLKVKISWKDVFKLFFIGLSGVLKNKKNKITIEDLLSKGT